MLFTFYMVFFHSLSNLPLNQPLFLGVHIRFWMQPHIVLFAFIPAGLHEVGLPLLPWSPSPPFRRPASTSLGLLPMHNHAVLAYLSFA